MRGLSELSINNVNSSEVDGILGEESRNSAPSILDSESLAEGTVGAGLLVIISFLSQTNGFLAES